MKSNFHKKGWAGIMTRFEKEAKGNSEMVYCFRGRDYWTPVMKKSKFKLTRFVYISQYYLLVTLF